MARTLTARRSTRGGAVVELAISALFLLLMLFGVVDFGRALLLRHAITSMSREAGNLASRGTPMNATLQSTILASGSTDLAQNGYVILTAITRDRDGQVRIAQQVQGGGLPQRSRVVTGSGVTLPNGGVPLRGQTLYVAEVFARFGAVTPIGNLIDSSFPSMLYDVAFF